MLSAHHKRANPFCSSPMNEDDNGNNEDVLMDVCPTPGKRTRWEETTPLRKRNLNQANSTSFAATNEPTFTLRDIERARDEGRMQSSQKVRALLTANEALRHALNEAIQERDKLVSDCKVLKTGVLTLNSRSHQLTKELESTTNQLREECEKNRALESAIISMHANWSMGGCRKDDQVGSGPNYDGDVF